MHMCVNLYLTEVQKYVKYGMYENILRHYVSLQIIILNSKNTSYMSSLVKA